MFSEHSPWASTCVRNKPCLGPLTPFLERTKQRPRKEVQCGKVALLRLEPSSAWLQFLVPV